MPRGAAVLRGARRGVALALVLASVLPYGRAVACRAAAEDDEHRHHHPGHVAANLLTGGSESGTASPDCHRAMACGISVVAIRRAAAVPAQVPLVRHHDAARAVTIGDRAIPPPLPPPPRA